MACRAVTSANAGRLPSTEVISPRMTRIARIKRIFWSGALLRRFSSVNHESTLIRFYHFVSISG